MPHRVSGLRTDAVVFLMCAGVTIIGLWEGQLGGRGGVVLYLAAFLSIAAYLTAEIGCGRADVRHTVKLASIVSCVSILTFLAAGILMGLRAQTAPHEYVHDNTIQIELALDTLLRGENPYTRDYFGTSLEAWPYPNNPALHHVIALPSHFVLSLPFRIVVRAMTGWYDQRVVYLAAFFATLAMLVHLAWARLRLLIALPVMFLTPYAIWHLAEGRNDALVFSAVVATTIALVRSRWRIAAVALGIAVTTKHSAWFLVPFVLAYMYGHAPGAHVAEKVRWCVRMLWPSAAVAAAAIIPFLVWDAPSFVQDVIGYPAGTLPTSYPMRGFGFSTLLVGANGPLFARSYFPFWIPQIIVGVPVLILLLRRQLRVNTAANLMAHYAVFLLLFWYFSRFFVENYLVYIVQVAAFAYLLAEDDGEAHAHAS